jgi:hypothetical protein
MKFKISKFILNARKSSKFISLTYSKKKSFKVMAKKGLSKSFISYRIKKILKRAKK